MLVGVRDSPGRASSLQRRTMFAAKNHARLRLQGGVEPRQGLRGISSRFDLDNVLHYALTDLPQKMRTGSSSGIIRSPATRTRDALWASTCLKMSVAD
jgi:hypothetical protein